MEYTVFRYRLLPTPPQQAQMEKTFRCCRVLWNRMLSDADEFYFATGLHFLPTPARYKKELPELREVDSQPLCTVHQNLDKAYKAHYRNPVRFRVPSPKDEEHGEDTFTVYCREYRTGPSVYLTYFGIQMPKLGLVPAKLHRLPGKGWLLRSVTVNRTRSGKYFASVAFGYEKPEVSAVVPEKVLTLAYSAQLFYIDHLGCCPDVPDFTKDREKIKKLQQRLSRMASDSRNYQETLQKLRLVHEHIANRRRDFIHQESTRIARDWDAVVVKDVPNRTQDGFGFFLECLRYKLERKGKSLIIDNNG